MRLSVIIPAHNEEHCIQRTISAISRELEKHTIIFEILIINDRSSDKTEEILKEICQKDNRIRYVSNHTTAGYGFAVRKGLENYAGDAAVIVMADGSDSPSDIVKYFQKLNEGYDCVFGSRFTKHSRVIDYPLHKLILNRFANWFIKTIFMIHYNDVTNAFKCYRREVIEGIEPLVSCHFNLTVEMPLKAIVRGYRYAIIPIDWQGRKEGVSKLKIEEMGSRYLFVVLYIWLEKHLSRRDYYRKTVDQGTKTYLQKDE